MDIVYIFCILSLLWAVITLLPPSDVSVDSNKKSDLAAAW
jgi:hypothetical protein